MENTFGIFDVFMILLILVFSIVGAIISRKLFNFFLGKDFPVDTLTEKLREQGYTLKSHKQIDENMLPQDIVFNQLWIFLRLCYRKSYYEIIATNDMEKSVEIFYLKYYQSLYLDGRYYFKRSDK